MWPARNTLQLPEPKWKILMSTAALLHKPSVLVNIEILSYSNRADSSSTVAPVPTLAQMLAGFDWLFLRLPEMPGSSLYRPGNWSGQIRNGPAQWAQIGISAWLEPIWRSAGVRFRRSFLISSSVCIQSIPRKRRPSKPHHLTSAFSLLIAILSHAVYSSLNCLIVSSDISNVFHIR